ncbi:MAG: non-ribosomal peptide synthetase, partial [Candidatus Aminicenantes bacterium]
GHCLYAVSKDTRGDGSKLLQYYKKHQIDISDGTPTHLGLLLESMKGNSLNPDIKQFIIGGEVLSQKLAGGFLNQFETEAPTITNVYGPSECCVDSTSYEIARKNIELLEVIPIGKPMPNHCLYIVGRKNRLQPLGAAGELCIGGGGVARGYLNNPELTSEKFDHDLWDLWDYQDGYHRSYMSHMSYKSYISKNIYKTGDLAKWLPDGNIKFIGRIDHQVKIRGFRIEPEEIENRLLNNGRIKGAIVTAGEDKAGDKYLCAYIAADKEFDVSGIREYLSEDLPAYMIPSYFIRLEKLPLTANGKIDREALPGPDAPRGSQVEYQAPGNDEEKRLAAVWQEVLGIERVGINDNFFELGGHSLKAIQIVSLLEHQGIKINVGDLFRYGDIKSLVEFKIRAQNKNKISKGSEEAKKEAYHLKDSISREEKEKLLKALARSIKRFNETILKERVIKSYPLSAMQNVHLKLSNRSSGTIMVFDGYGEQKKLLDSIINLIRREGLLRSKVVNQGKELLWYEHEMPKGLDLPFVDLSGYGPGIKDEIASLVISRYFPNKDIDVKILPYSIVLIKKNPEDYLLVFAADHIVYDAMSGQIVRTNIDRCYYSKEETEGIEKSNGSNGRSYEEYVNQINKGPQQVDEGTIIEMFELDDFRNSIIEVNRIFKQKRSIRFVTHEIDIHFKDISTPADDKKPLEISLKIYALLCKALFGIEKVPLLFFNFGRKYEDKTFFSTVGEFIDLLPMVVNTNNSDNNIHNITAKIEEKIAFASKHNINFMTTVMNEEVSRKWTRVTRRLTPDGVGYDKNLLRFNFIGKTDNIELKREKGSEENKKKRESVQRYDVELEGATFWSSYNKDRLKIAVGMNMEIDREEFCERLKLITRQVIDDFKE